jgi:MFS family permease
MGYSAAAVVAVGIVWRHIPESLERDSEHPGTGASTMVNLEKGSKKKTRIPRQMMILLGIMLLTFSAGEIMSPIWIQYIFDNITPNLFLIALSFLPAALAGAFLPSHLGGLSDRIGRRKPIIVALVISSLATLAIPFMRSLWPLALLSFLEAAAFAAAVPAEEALVTDLTDEDHQGLALGMYTAAAGLGAVFGPLIGAWIYMNFSATAVFGMSAFLMIVGAFLIYILIKEPFRNSR